MQRRKATANIVNGMRAIHPGEVLREEFLLPLGLTANALAIALQVPAPRINDVAREKRGVSADTALRLARYCWQQRRVLDGVAGRLRPENRRARTQGGTQAHSSA